MLGCAGQQQRSPRAQMLASAAAVQVRLHCRAQRVPRQSSRPQEASSPQGALQIQSQSTWGLSSCCIDQELISDGVALFKSTCEAAIRLCHYVPQPGSTSLSMLTVCLQLLPQVGYNELENHHSCVCRRQQYACTKLPSNHWRNT